MNWSILDKLSKKDLSEEKLEIISIRSQLNDDAVGNFISKSIKDVENIERLTKVINIVEKSESIVIDKSEGIVNENIVESGEENEETKKKVVKIITKVIEKNPEKAVEIFKKNKNTEDLSKNIKTKIENKESITSDDFGKVFEKNISPN